MLQPGFKVAETRNRLQLTTMVYDGHYVLCLVGLTAMIYYVHRHSGLYCTLLADIDRVNSHQPLCPHNSFF